MWLFRFYYLSWFCSIWDNTYSTFIFLEQFLLFCYNVTNFYLYQQQSTNFLLTNTKGKSTKYMDLLQYQSLKSTNHYTKIFLLHNTNSHDDCLSVVNIFSFNHFHWLAEVSINASVTFSFTAVLELFLLTFDRFFLSGFILMSHFISYIFLQSML